MLTTRGYIHDNEYCTVLRECSLCGLDFTADTLIICVEAGVTPLCDHCRERAEAVAGAEELTELLAEGELELYFGTIGEINRMLDGEWTGTWN